MRYLVLLLGFIFVVQLNAQNSLFKGKIYTAEGKNVVSGATITIPALNTGTTTNEWGVFSLNVKPGIYNVEFSAVGFVTQKKFQIEFTSAKPIELEVLLEKSAISMKGAEIVEDAYSRTKESPLSIQSLSAFELERMPGAALDVSKVIRSLPGVSPKVSFGYNLIIRGGASSENKFYLDGIEIPTLTHFTVQGTSGGPNGIVNARMLRSAELHTGAFPSNRPNALSSVLEMSQKEGRKDKFGGSFNLGYSDWGFQLEGPMGKKSSFFFSARESYVQHVLEALGLPVIPTYSDIQYKQVFRPNAKNEITLIALAADDKYVLNLHPKDSSDALMYNVGYIPEGKIYQYTTGIHYKHYLPKSVYSVVVSRNWLLNRAEKFRDNVHNPENLLMKYQSIEGENKIRIEQKGWANQWEWAYGINAELDQIQASNYSFYVQRTTQVDTIQYNNVILLGRYGGFGSLSRIWGDVSLNAGLRFDGTNYNQFMSNPLHQLSPRVAVSYLLAKGIWLNASAGSYYQLPSYVVMMYGQQNQLENQVNLKYIRSNQIVLGIEHKNQSGYQLKLEGYYKKYSQYPFLLSDSLSLANANANYVLVGNQKAVSTSNGRAYGLEFQAKQQMKKNFFWMVNASYVVSQFEDKNGKLVSSAWDNRYFATISAGKVMKKLWQVGVRYAYIGGNPYTPYDVAFSSLAAVWNVNQRGVFDYSNQLNNNRLPSIGQLDVRVDKTFNFKKKTLNVFLDLANAMKSSLPSVPYLVLERDANHQPQLIKTNPAQYQTKLINSDTGRMLYTLGIMFDF